MIALIDYGAGNLASVRKGFAAVGAELALPTGPGDLDRFDGLVLPGVGHFGATAAISADWRAAISRRIEARVPFLGICVGMQWLFEGSAESSGVPGLGLVGGQCTRLRAARPLKVPHVGWNRLEVARAGWILDGIVSGTHVYFTHAYAGPVGAACVATASHGEPFAAAVERDNVAGVQFHPEKSGPPGLRILRNFVARTRS